MEATLPEVPIVDLGAFRSGERAARAEIGAAVDRALCEIGFLVVINHGIDATVVRDAFAAAARFFDRDLDDKNTIRIVPGTLPRGYLPYGAVVLAQTEGKATPPDLKESFGFGPEHFGENKWPEGDDAFRHDAVTCFEAIESIMHEMLELFAVALGIGEDWFDDKFANHNSTLRLFNYPPLTEPPLPDQLRSGVHTDYGALTLLAIGDDDPGGLQVLNRSKEWVDVHAPPNSFVINVGDLLMMWSNDRWLSNLHRVVLPDDPALAMRRRQSMGFFANPRADVLIECLPNCSGPGNPAKHPVVEAGKHRLNKVKASEPKQ
ncbi:MAG: isopenicillin N synthase family dioxygenase [Acidimicrobiia bacterium]